MFVFKDIHLHVAANTEILQHHLQTKDCMNVVKTDTQKTRNPKKQKTSKTNKNKTQQFLTTINKPLVMHL